MAREIRHAERRAESARRSSDASFLAEASRLLADSLDYETTLSTVAMLALPQLGAWCIVDIVEDDGGIRRLAIVHPDPDLKPLARELRRGWPPSRDDPVGVPAVTRSRRSEIIREVDDALLRRMARGRANLEILRRLGIGSILTVPLMARGDILGAMTFVGPETGPRFDQGDLELAQDLAARAAIAIDNARLYRLAQQSRDTAERASEAKSQFLGVMSHELRTPINAILGYAQLLDMGVRGPLNAEQRVLLQRLDGSARHLMDLVTRVLDVAKAESGDLSIQTQVHRVADVVRGALDAIRPMAPGRRIERLPELDDQARFFGDAIRARQVLMNLLTNAIQHAGTDATVRIGWENVPGPVGPTLLQGTGPWVRITVEDDGPGIAGDRLDAIFEPFVQGDDRPLTRESYGSGLGLAVSRYLARLMGGDLTAVSVPGEGSRFSVWLPAPRRNETDRDRRLFRREARGLDRLADHLLRRLKPITDAYVDRLRQDGGVPRAREASDTALRDHVPQFLAGMAGLLATGKGSGGEISALLQGGNAIQRLTLELHGAERLRMGWSADALRRDLAILRDIIETDLRAHGREPGDLSGLTDVIERLFEQAERISLQGWHYARSDDAGSDG